MLLEITGLGAGYGHVRVLRQVSLSIHAGEIVTLIGANGAGKTTLLRAISGILRANAGRVVFDGQELTVWSPEKIVAAGVVHIPERRQLFGAPTRLEVEMADAALRAASAPPALPDAPSS